MKFFQKKSVAMSIMIAAIVLAVVIGQVRKPVQSVCPAPEPEGNYALDDLSTSGYGKWINDAAGVLSSRTEDMIALYNANWDARYRSLVAVLTVDEVAGDIVDLAYDYGYELGLGDGDAILVLDIGGEAAYLAPAPISVRCLRTAWRQII